LPLQIFCRHRLRIALIRLAEDFQLHRAQPVRVEARNVPDGLPPLVSTALYRIVQEALRNIAKHASTAAVTITLAGEPDALRLIIEDTGPGFAPQEVRFRGGLGLISMQERATLAGGTLRLTSSPGQGTIIEVHLPLRQGGK
jgi:signal transduction histidine kinase